MLGLQLRHIGGQLGEVEGTSAHERTVDVVGACDLVDQGDAAQVQIRVLPGDIGTEVLELTGVDPALEGAQLGRGVAGHAGSDPPGLEQDHLRSAERELVGGGAPDDATADHDHLAGSVGRQ